MANTPMQSSRQSLTADDVAIWVKHLLLHSLVADLGYHQLSIFMVHGLEQSQRPSRAKTHFTPKINDFLHVLMLGLSTLQAT